MVALLRPRVAFLQPFVHTAHAVGSRLPNLTHPTDTCAALDAYGDGAWMPCYAKHACVTLWLSAVLLKSDVLFLTSPPLGEKKKVNQKNKRPACIYRILFLHHPVRLRLF